MTITFTRSGTGRARVREGEWFESDGTTFKAWRQVAPKAVGWFGGNLTASESDRLRRATEACETAAPPEAGVARPGASLISVVIDGTTMSCARGTEPGGPWGAAVSVIDELLDAITDRPTAAVAITYEDGRARLSRRGDDHLIVDLEDGLVIAIAWRGWYEEAARFEGALSNGPTATDAGWTYEIDVGDVGDAPDTTVHVTVEFAIGTDERTTRVAVSYAPDLPRP